MPEHNIAVIGAGPVGSIMAAYLAHNQENVFLIDIRKELIDAIKENGITLIGGRDNFVVRMKGTGYSTASLNQFDADYIFIAVKFNFLDPLLEEIKPIFKPAQKIVIIQNGIDNEDSAAKKLSRNDILRFVINYAGMIIQPGTVKMSFFNPPNYIGALSPENEPVANEIAKFIGDSGLETLFTPDIKRYEWKKTILNAGLMPVCAATGLTMMEAMGTKETRYLCAQILVESIQVAKKVGYEYESNFLENCLAYLDNAGNHKPSTLMDLEAGNPIEYIFQSIIDYGKKLDSPTPFLESLTKVVRTLEKQKRKPKP